ncbi:LuxR C-terminal-related transcriptional regulator [Caldicellulosiruptoraceae bacterium PP1]
MNQTKINRKIIVSHRRCKKLGLQKTIISPIIILKKDELKLRLRKNDKLINIFKNCIESITSPIKNKYIFILTDCEGYLLEMVYEKKKYLYIDKYNFKIGMSFSEHSIGTNAISIAMEMKKTICLKPHEHYCEILKKWYCIAAPLLINDKDIIGYIDISTIEERIVDEMILCFELLREKICNEYKMLITREKECLKESLTDKQINVLRLCAKGYKEAVISEELKINIATVKYHKKQIIYKLQTKSIQEAVAKAVKLNLISI